MILMSYLLNKKILNIKRTLGYVRFLDPFVVDAGRPLQRGRVRCVRVVDGHWLKLDVVAAAGAAAARVVAAAGGAARAVVHVDALLGVGWVDSMLHVKRQ